MGKKMIMGRWNQSKKSKNFLAKVGELKTKVSVFTEEYWRSCSAIGLEVESFKEEVNIITECIKSLETLVCSAVPEYILDGGAARLVEVSSLLTTFQGLKLNLGKPEEGDDDRERLDEIASAIHISAENLNALKLQIENGLAPKSSTRWLCIVGGIFFVSGELATIYLWLTRYGVLRYFENYWGIGLSILVFIVGLFILLKSQQKWFPSASRHGGDYMPKSTEQKNLINALCAFFLTKDIDYANMINGRWGAGKTYFIKTVMQPIIQASGKKLFYVSLNGVKTFDDIVCQIVFGSKGSLMAEVRESCVVPLCEKYLPKETSRFFMSNWRSLVNVVTGKANHICTRMGDFLPDRSIVFIDDVERIEQDKDLKQLMGKVHEEFVCKGYHVVYVGDESAITFLQEFNKVKEKYIRHTYHFPLDVSAIVDMFIASYPNGSKDRRHAELCKESLKKFAYRFNIQNARTIKRILDDFLFLSNQIGDETLLSQIAEILLHRIAPIVNELATGRLNAFDNKALESLQNIGIERQGILTERLLESSGHQAVPDREQKDKPVSYAREFISRYDVDRLIEWRYEQAIVSYELFGLYDCQKIREAAKCWMAFIPDKYTIALNTIWNGNTMEDEKLSDSCPIVEEGLRMGKYTAENAQLACELLHSFHERGWISIDYDNTVNLAVKALRNRWKSLPNDYINPMMLQYSRNEDFLQPIVNAIREEVIAQQKRSAEEYVSKFLTALTVKDKESAGAFLPRNQSWLIFDKIVNVGKAKDFCDISNWGITCILVNLKEGPVLIRPSSRGAIEQIVQELNIAIEACDIKKTPIRKDRLEALKAKFSEILNSPEFQQVAERQEATAQNTGTTDIEAPNKG